MITSPQSVGDALDCLDELSEDCERVSVGSIMDAFGSRTYGPMIMIPALLELTPVGAIPGVPTFLAVTIMLVAAQKMIGRRHPWLPPLIAERTISGEKLDKGVHKLRPVADVLDRWFHRRLKFMTRWPFAQIAAGIVILLCLTVPFLEVLPFASSVPMFAIAGFGLAVLLRDGVVMIVALAISFAALGMGVDYWDGGMSDTEEVDGLVDQQTVDEVKVRAEEARAAAEQAGEDIEKSADDAASSIKKTTEEASQKAADVLESE